MSKSSGLDEGPAQPCCQASEVEVIKPFNDDDRQMAMWLLELGSRQVETAEACIRNLQQKLTAIGATAGVAAGLWLNAVAGLTGAGVVAVVAWLSGLCFVAAVVESLGGVWVVVTRRSGDALDWWAYLIDERAGNTRQALLADQQSLTTHRETLAARLAKRVKRASIVFSIGLALALVAGLARIIEMYHV